MLDELTDQEHLSCDALKLPEGRDDIVEGQSLRGASLGLRDARRRSCAPYRGWALRITGRKSALRGAARHSSLRRHRAWRCARRSAGWPARSIQKRMRRPRLSGGAPRCGTSQKRRRLRLCRLYARRVSRRLDGLHERTEDGLVCGLRENLFDHRVVVVDADLLTDKLVRHQAATLRLKPHDQLLVRIDGRREDDLVARGADKLLALDRKRKTLGDKIERGRILGPEQIHLVFPEQALGNRDR